jgi:hypothetical protein
MRTDQSDIYIRLYIKVVTHICRQATEACAATAVPAATATAAVPHGRVALGPAGAPAIVVVLSTSVDFSAPEAILEG